MQVNELFTQPNTILLDGGMGTMLQAAGLKLGARPEELNLTDPALIEGIHAQYLSLIHISEPTRRTPISYAVFCLKKKKKHEQRCICRD